MTGAKLGRSSPSAFEPRKLSIHHLIAPDVSAETLVDLAGALSCEHVCLFTQAPADAKTLPVVRDEDMANLTTAMARTGVTAYGVTSFPVAPDTDPLAYRAGLEKGAGLGAVRANVRILDPDPGRAADRFAVIGEMCSDLGMLACIEFTGYDAPDVIPRTLDIIRQAGRGALTLDALHVVRTLTPWTVLEALSPEMIGYIQICDGPLAASRSDYDREGPLDRLPPGDGAFPLARMLSIAPDELPLSLEVPCLSMRRLGLAPTEIVARIVERTRRWQACLQQTQGV